MNYENLARDIRFYTEQINMRLYQICRLLTFIAVALVIALALLAATLCVIVFGAPDFARLAQAISGEFARNTPSRKVEEAIVASLIAGAVLIVGALAGAPGLRRKKSNEPKA